MEVISKVHFYMDNIYTWSKFVKQIFIFILGFIKIDDKQCQKMYE